MLHSVVLLIIACRWLESVFADEEAASDGDFGSALISSLKNDANLDLSVDEEYEDLRAEALAYHSALTSLKSSRRSLITTECWKQGGICINFNLCPGYRQLTEVPGCKNRYNVCCFVWNQFEVRDMRDKGFGNIAFPWSLQREYGGEGIQQVTPDTPKKKKKTNKVTESTINDYKRLYMFLYQPLFICLPMVLIVGFVVFSIIISSVFEGLSEPLRYKMPLLHKYKDVFIGSQGGKPQLGTMKATCWARGGICIHIRLCPGHKNFDIAVGGCSSNFNVCCKLFQQLSPTVGIQRSGDEEEDSQEID